jgi:ribosomal protein S18 acetylase RimI-like enzyme
MDLLSLETPRRDSTKISHNLNYPLWQLEDVLLPLFTKSYDHESLQETIRSANHVWCAYKQHKCLACALMTDIGTNGGLYIILFGVRRSAQGQGIGKNLLESLIVWARHSDYRFIYLHTEEDNLRAIGMYERAGFRRESDQSALVEQLPKFGQGIVPMILFLVEDE